MGIKKDEITRGRKAGDQVITLRVPEEYNTFDLRCPWTPSTTLKDFGLTLVKLNILAAKNTLTPEDQLLSEYSDLNTKTVKVSGFKRQRHLMKLTASLKFDRIMTDIKFIALMKSMMVPQFTVVHNRGMVLRKKSGVLITCTYGTPNHSDFGVYITKVGRKVVADMLEEEYREEVGSFGQDPSLCNIENKPKGLTVVCPILDRR